MNKKTYIHPELQFTQFASALMQVPESFPQGNGDDPELGEDDQLVKERHNDVDWGSLW